MNCLSYNYYALGNRQKTRKSKKASILELSKELNHIESQEFINRINLNDVCYNTKQ